MHVDWMTVAAQIVNFLLLVALLRRFLYGPIVRAMAEREQRIVTEWDSARSKAAEAEQERQRFEAKNSELATMGESLLHKAQAEAAAVRRKLVSEARGEADALQAGWRKALERERELFLNGLRERIATYSCALARHTLETLADARLEQSIVESFLARLQKLDDGTRTEFAEALRAADGKLVVRSAFELSEPLRRRLALAVEHEILSTATPSFELEPELLSGIELCAAGRSIAWNLSSSMADLEERLLGHPG